MIFSKECVRGILRDKTIILVTHQVDFLHNVDLILVSTLFIKQFLLVNVSKAKDALQFED